MMSSILIHGGTERERKETAQQLLFEHKIVGRTDLVRVGENEEKIGIREIKELLPHLNIHPKGAQRGVLILEAQRLTTQAQNALLKTLEEPPLHLTIILTVPHPRLLLPTVVSRCLLLQTGKIHKKETFQADGIRKILAAKPGKRLALFEENYGYDRESIFTFLDAIENQFQENLTPENAQRLKKLWRAKKLLREETANTKLIVDELLISW